MKVTCPNCNSPWQFRADACGRTVKCPACGTPVKIVSSPNAPRCPRCKAVMATNAVVCINCGFDRRTGAAVAAGLASEVTLAPRRTKRVAILVGACAAVVLGAAIVWLALRVGNEQEPAVPPSAEATPATAGEAAPAKLKRTTEEKVAVALRAVQANDDAVGQAAKTIADTGAPAVARLEAILQQDDVKQAEAAYRLLSTIGRKRPALLEPTLLKALLTASDRYSKQPVRDRCALCQAAGTEAQRAVAHRILGQLGEGQSPEDIARALLAQSPSAGDVGGALTLLGCQAIPAILDHLERQSPEQARLNERCWNALTRLGWKPRTPRGKFLLCLHKGEWSRLPEIVQPGCVSQSVVRSLIAMIEARDDTTPAAVRTLGKLKERAATGPLIRLLKETQRASPKTAKIVAEALADIGNPAAIDPLIEAMGYAVPLESMVPASRSRIPAVWDVATPLKKLAGVDIAGRQAEWVAWRKGHRNYTVPLPHWQDARLAPRLPCEAWSVGRPAHPLRRSARRSKPERTILSFGFRVENRCTCEVLLVLGGRDGKVKRRMRVAAGDRCFFPLPQSLWQPPAGALWNITDADTFDVYFLLARDPTTVHRGGVVHRYLWRPCRAAGLANPELKKRRLQYRGGRDRRVPRGSSRLSMTPTPFVDRPVTMTNARPVRSQRDHSEIPYYYYPFPWLCVSLPKVPPTLVTIVDPADYEPAAALNTSVVPTGMLPPFKEKMVRGPHRVKIENFWFHDVTVGIRSGRAAYYLKNRETGRLFEMPEPPANVLLYPGDQYTLYPVYPRGLDATVEWGKTRSVRVGKGDTECWYISKDAPENIRNAGRADPGFGEVALTLRNPKLDREKSLAAVKKLRLLCTAMEFAAKGYNLKRGLKLAKHILAEFPNTPAAERAAALHAQLREQIKGE